MPCDFHQTTGPVGIGPWLEIPVKRQCDKMHKYAERAKKIKVRKCLRICIIPDKTPDLQAESELNSHFAEDPYRLLKPK